MANNKLTRKEKGFVKDYAKTGIGSRSIKKHYNVAKDVTARSMAYENLTKPHIIEALAIEEKKLADRIPDDLVSERHLELLNKREVIVIDGEIVDRGPDVQGVSKGLDMAYKLKGSYAPEKSTSVNLNLEVKPEDKDLEAIRLRFEEELKAKLMQ